jgi:cytochrome c biogenesis protein CcdA
MKGNVAAIVLIVFGVFFLLTNLGLISISLAELLKTWWPVILIAVGVSLLFTPGNQKKKD